MLTQSKFLFARCVNVGSVVSGAHKNELSRARCVRLVCGKVRRLNGLEIVFRGFYTITQHNTWILLYVIRD
jgi:hypothetical protein